MKHFIKMLHLLVGCSYFCISLNTVIYHAIKYITFHAWLIEHWFAVEKAALVLRKWRVRGGAWHITMRLLLTIHFLDIEG